MHAGGQGFDSPHLHQRVLDWRLELRERYAVPIDRELHACDLLAGRGKLAHDGNADHRLTPEQGVEIFTGGLRVMEDAARTIGGVEVVNVCLRKPDVKGYERAPASTGSSTASIPPSQRRTVTLSSSSTRAARR